MGSNKQQDGFTVVDEGDLRKYRTEIPNLIDDLDMSVYAFRLYVHLKRVAGEGGKSFQGTRTLAEHCRMSMGSVSKAKTELVELDLIAIEKGDPKTNTPDHIRIKNIWPQNFMRYSKPPDDGPVQDTNDPVHAMNTPVHQANDPVHGMNERKNPSKKEPYKKEPSKKGEGASAPPPPDDAPPLGVVEYFDPRKLHNGRMPPGAGSTPIEVYLESFSISEMKRAGVAFDPTIKRKLEEEVADLERWRQAVSFWKFSGYRPGNWIGMLDRYHDGVQGRRSSSGAPPDQPEQSAGSNAVDRVFARFMQGGASE